MTANYHSIESFSSVDGPGIRYVLFLQGCNMNCKFCHNVDTISMGKNKTITSDEVVNDFLKYKAFYKRGGITVSGGEPLLQIDFIIELFIKLKKLNIHTCIETQGSLFKENDKFKKLIEVTDLFIIDLKGVDNNYSKDICGYNMDSTYKFMEYLNKINEKFIITYVLLPNMNDDEYCAKTLALILDEYNNTASFEILPYHRLGVEKWEKLNLEYTLKDLKEPSKEDVNIFYDKIKNYMKKEFKKGF